MHDIVHNIIMPMHLIIFNTRIIPELCMHFNQCIIIIMASYNNAAINIRGRPIGVSQ